MHATDKEIKNLQEIANRADNKKLSSSQKTVSFKDARTNSDIISVNGKNKRRTH